MAPNAYGNIVNTLRYIQETFRDIANVVDIIRGYFSNLSDKIRDRLGPIADMGDKVWKRIQNIVQTVWKTLRAGLERVVIDIRDLVELLQFGLAPLLIAASVLRVFARKEMAESIRKGVEAMKELYPVLAKIGSIVGKVLNAAFLAFYYTLFGLGQATNWLIDRLIEVKAVIVEQWSAITDWISDWVTKIKNTVQRGIDYLVNIKDAIADFIDKIKQKITEFLEMIGVSVENDSGKPMKDLPGGANDVTFNIDLKDAVIDSKQELIDDLYNEITRRIGF